MALDDRYATDCSGMAQSDRLCGLLPFEIHESGRGTGATALSELRKSTAWCSARSRTASRSPA